MNTLLYEIPIGRSFFYLHRRYYLTNVSGSHAFCYDEKGREHSFLPWTPVRAE